MSRENAEVVRSVIEAHNRGDFATVLAAYDPEIEWDIERMPPASGMEPVYHGHEGVGAFFREWFAAWETASFEYEELIDAGDRIVTIVSQRMRGRTSGVELEWSSYAQVWTVRNHKVVRVEHFPTRSEAIEALGIRE